MFFPGSRYANMAQYQVTLQNGAATVTATTLPLPVQGPLLGSFPRRNSQRLDQIAYYFLSDATAFWQLCNVNNALVPDALAVQPAVGIPASSS
jgi:hypothetical protein